MTSKKLIDLDVMSKESYHFEKLFNQSTQCISSLVLAFLHDFESPPFKKIIFQLYEKLDPDFSDELTFLGDVVVKNSYFDFEHYFEESVANKKRIIFELIFENLRPLCDGYDWSFRQLDEAYSILNDSNLDNFRYLKKKKSNPNRKLKIQLGYHHEIDCIRIVGHIFNKKDELIDEVNFAKIEPHEWFLVQYVGDVKWLSNTEVCLTPKNPDLDAIKNELDH